MDAVARTLYFGRAEEMNMNGKQDIVDLIKEEIIDSDVSGRDLRIVLDILDKYKKEVNTPDVMPLLTQDNYTDYYNYCKHCPNNINNGGSGICHCILGTRVFY